MVLKSLRKKVSLKKTTAKKETKPKTNKTILKFVDKKELNLKNDSNIYIVIDYPVESEAISSCHYAVRVGASGDGYVELSFNNGEWVPCRFSSGYWWFDWTCFAPGEHLISARLVNSAGNVILQTQNRKCKVW
ncbi:MAG: hypothetical protein LBJ79_01135 [Endomicrobium sp.]|jgi:hypothetical protein|nr:hypothetical protein [Endomicrobium sp.]